MRIPFLPLAFVLLGAPSFAHGESDNDRPFFIPDYVQISVGGVFSDDAEDVPGGTISFDPGYEVSAALGWHVPFSQRFGLDLEFESYYQNFTVDEEDLLKIPTAVSSAIDDDAVALAWMLNGMLEWHFTPQFAVYGGGGIGYATTLDYDSWDSGNLDLVDQDGAAFQGRFGFLYNLGGNYDVLLGYRYFRAESLEIDDTSTSGDDGFDLDVGQHVIEAAFRWSL